MSYSIAVRALCEFTAKVGDLDLRFTPSPTAQEGIVGHRTVASRRSEGYQSEVALEGQYQTLTVKGRADGYDPGQNCLEEVKTYRGDLSKQPANHRQLHWAQVKIYGWLMCRKLDLARINLALVYFDIVSERKPAWSSLSTPSSCNNSSSGIARCSCNGPNRKSPIVKGAIWPPRAWPFPMPVFDQGSAIWPNRCSRPSAPGAA